MDNFRNKRRPNSGSIDGFVSHRQPPKRVGNDLRNFDQYYRPQIGQRPDMVAPKVDSFHGLDGFSPSVQPTITNPASINKPVELSMSSDEQARESKRPKFEHNEPKPKNDLFLVAKVMLKNLENIVNVK